MFNKSIMVTILLYVNKITKYWYLLLYLIVFKCVVNYNIMGIDFMLDFMIEIHEGSHRHAYIYRWFCPVIVCKAVWGFCTGINRTLFYVFVLLFFMWTIKEVISRNRSSDRGILTTFNKLVVLDFLNKKKLLLSYNFNQLFLKTTVLIHSVSSNKL